MKNTDFYFRLRSLVKPMHVVVLMLSAFGLVSLNATAQPQFTRTTFNAAYTPITIDGGATSSTATGDNANETGIPIGFSFNYNGVAYTTIGLSTNGVAWFDAVAPATTAGNVNMVTTSGPNQSLAPWFNNLIDDVSSDILYQTQGSEGSRTFTIQYTNYPTFTGTPGSNVRMNCQVILYETTNVIEFCYGSLNVIGAQTTSGGAMIAIEWGAGGLNNFIDAVTGSSVVSHRMLSPLSGWPSYNFRFTPGAPTAIPAGSYDVGVGQTYNSLTEAIAEVNHRGISGAVTLHLTDAQYDTTAANGSNIFPLFVATPNADAINSLTISKTGTPATLAYRGSSISASGAGWGTGVGTTAIGHGSEPLLGVCASYTTISNVNLITHGAPQTVEIGLAVFELFNNKGAQHNLFDKISVDLNRAHGADYGIASFSTASTGGFAGSNSYNTYRDINIKDCNVGISLNAPNNATGPADEGNQIITSSCSTYNYIGDPNVADDIIGGGSYGISIGGQYSFTIRNCIIQNITGTATTGEVDGILVANSWGSNEISNNIIRTLRRSNAAVSSSRWVSGIRIYWDNQAMSFKIFNNSISNLLSSYAGVPSTQTGVVGIYFPNTGPGTVASEIYNNSISIDGSTFPNASSLCFSVLSVSETFQIKNNVFANYTTGQTGVAYHTCFYTNAASQYGDASSLADYNNYYLADLTNGSIGKAISTNYTTLAAWQAAMTVNPGTDVNSQLANPFFKNKETDLHGTYLSASLDGLGTAPPSYVTTDADCETRNAPQDIGYDDFTSGCIANGGIVSPASATACAKDLFVMSSSGVSEDPSASYQWMVSETSGGPYTAVTGGSGATSTSYTTGKLKKGIFYYVLQATCPGGGTDFSSELMLDVKAQPAAAITPEGPVAICKGDDVLLTASGGSNRAYQWLKKDEPISGATDISYTAGSKGKYKVFVTNTTTGCTNTSVAVKITEYEDPTAIITPQGPTTFCEGGSVVLQANTGDGLTYQWRKGSNFISGATLSSYTATTQGNYKVEITNANGCTKASDIVEVTVPCKEDGKVPADFSVSIFPNPATDQVQVVTATTADFEVELTSVTGERMMLLKNESIVDVSKLAAGIYFLKISTADFAVTQKLVKQ